MWIEIGLHFLGLGDPVEGEVIAEFPDIIGGRLKAGQKAIKLGKNLLNPTAFHAVKKTFLAKVGANNFARIVGDNPDISFKGTKIILQGAKNAPAQFRGKTFETSFSITEFLEMFF